MKAHLLDSDEPLQAGHDQEGLCGKCVSKAHFVWMFDSEFGEPWVNSMLVCRKCKSLLAGIVNPGRYLYGLIDGEKAKHLEEL
jgi:hypothetical protein